MKSTFSFVLLVLLLYPFYLEATEPFKKIENKFYSFSIPESWTPYQDMDGYKPKERDDGFCFLSYLSWHTPIRKVADIEDLIMIDVDTYERLDKEEITIQEVCDQQISFIENSAVEMEVLEEIPEKNNRKTMSLIKKTKEFQGGFADYFESFLFLKQGERVHFIKLNMKKHVYQQPETPALIQQILDSFVFYN